MPASHFVRRACVIPAGSSALLLALFGHLFGPSALRAQQPAPTVADAARMARQHRKQLPPASLVWTNANIPREPGMISVVGQPLGQGSSSPLEDVTSPPVSASGAEDAGKKFAGLQEALQLARGQLASLRTDLDLLDRQHLLDQKQFYGTPDFSRNSDAKASLDAEVVAISAKSDEVKAAQARVTSLENQLAEPPADSPSVPKPTGTPRS